ALTRQKARQYPILQAPGLGAVEQSAPTQRNVQWGLRLECLGRARCDRLRLAMQLEPEESVRPKRQRVGLPFDGGKLDVSQHLDRHHPFVGREVQLDRLGKARQVSDAENLLALVVTDVRQDFPIRGVEKLERSAPKDPKQL